jgi:amidase
MQGLMATMLSQEHIVPVIGPMSTSLAGCKLFMQTIIDQQPWLTEPSLVPLPWRTPTNLLTTKSGTPKKLKVAILWDDGVVHPHPPITRALRETAAKLQTIPTIEVVPWQPYAHAHAWRIIASLYFADGAAEEKAAIAASAEPWRPLSRFIISDNPYCRELSIAEMWDLTAQRNEYRTEYARRWNETAVDGDPESAVDVILCPVGPGAAPPLDHARYWGYTAQWNLLDYPALVFPVGRVERRVDVGEEWYQPRNEQDRWNWELCESSIAVCFACSAAPV